jgi:hypothetical protein
MERMTPHQDSPQRLFKPEHGPHLEKVLPMTNPTRKEQYDD